MTPFGNFAPRRVKRSGSFRYKMISCNSSLTSSQPFTSSNVVLTSSTGVTFFEPMPKPFCTLPAKPSASTDIPATISKTVMLERISRHIVRRLESAICTFNVSVVGRRSSTVPEAVLPVLPSSFAAVADAAFASRATSRHVLPKRRSKSTKSKRLARTSARMYSRTASLLSNTLRGSCCSNKRIACCGSKWLRALRRSASL
mmetsp:Transcript_109305/g.308445  ORF Transcript_109305/g.308445 Transcript_109305/m.308445 type:complete len:201 (-) Transcript_109305:315-917(-)